MNSTGNQFPLWFDHLSLKVLIRSLILALFIGSVLTLVNQFSALLGGEGLKILPLVQVFVTPFAVITLSQLSATQQAIFDSPQSRLNGRSSIFHTMFTHGIPLRAALIALAAVGINGLISIVVMPQSSAVILQSSWPLLAQSFVVPLIFGAFSQAVTYRRYLAI